MLRIEHTQVMGFESALRGMRNPKNSWDRADSGIQGSPFSDDGIQDSFFMGKNDHDLAMRLAKGGSVHAKYRRMIVVYCDITAPLYWWKEFDTYKVGTVANSCSTMHKIAAKEFTLDDFSHEHLDEAALDVLRYTIVALNNGRDLYLKTKNKDWWWQMIQLLPSSYNQRRTVMLNYEVLSAMYKDRKDHKLDEWHTLCDWIAELPYSELIVGTEAEHEPDGHE